MLWSFGPALVGLQGVALWQTFPVDASGKPIGPPTVTYDFEKILLDKLAAHGVSYTTAVKRIDFSVAGGGGVQPQQMQELLTGPVTTTLPIVVAGDFNTTPGASAPSAYTEALNAGFADEWAEGNGDPGYTAFQVLPTINNPTSNLSLRIDYVLGRGRIAPQNLYLVGATSSARTPSGFWPADHAGVVATLKIL